MEMEEEIEWRLKEMEGGRREAETGLEMVKRKDTEKTRKERKKITNARFGDTWVKNPFGNRLPKSYIKDR